MEGTIQLGAELAEEGKDWEAMTYSARGLRIRIVFDEGKAVFISYANENIFSFRQSDDPAIGLTGDEISYLRVANVGKSRSWAAYKDTTLAALAPATTVWKSSDGEFYAAYNRDENRFFVCSQAFWDLVVGRIRERIEEGATGDAATRLKGL